MSLYLNNPVVVHAIEYATKAHNGTYRKYHPDKVPYIVHPWRVLIAFHEYLERYCEGHGLGTTVESLCCVAVLHDVVEDCGVSIEQIDQEFGSTVATGVKWLTKISKDQPALPRKDRVAMDIRHFQQAPWYIQAIKLLDRIDNLRDTANAPHSWLLRYIYESELLLEALGNDNTMLLVRLQNEINTAKRRIP